MEDGINAPGPMRENEDDCGTTNMDGATRHEKCVHGWGCTTLFLRPPQLWEIAFPPKN